MRDVVVIGGGPGGLFAASRLAASGSDVLVLEEHDLIGEPVHCTGVLAEDAVRELDLPRNAILNLLSTARFLSPSGRELSYTTPMVEAVVIDRTIFDGALAARASVLGAEVRRGVRAAHIAIDDAGVSITLGDGTRVRSRAAVLAYGARYTFQRQLGLGVPAVFLQSAQLELACDCPGDVELHFGSTIAPKGFAWSVPVLRGNRWMVRAGVMCGERASEFFAQHLRRIAPRWGVPVDVPPPRRRMLPLSSLARTYTDRLLVVGDAAGLVKSTTGGGIFYSIVSGSIAAEVLIEALRDNALGADRLRVYQSRWRSQLRGEFQAQLAFRLLVQKLSDAEIDRLFELAQTDGIMPIIRRTARFNQHRNLILALFRHPPARRLLFRRLATT